MVRKTVQLIPVSDFETIAERTKSVNKRQSRAPKRFGEEFQYWPQLVAKREPSPDPHYLSRHGLESQNTSITSESKQKYCRRNAVKKVVKKEALNTSTDRMSSDEYIGSGRMDSRLSVTSNPFEYQVFSSTPKPFDPKVRKQAMSSHKNGLKPPVLQMPPQLVPIDERVDNEVEVTDVLPAPPTLEPVVESYSAYHCMSNGLKANRYLKSNNVCKREMALNECQNRMNGESKPKPIKRKINIDFELFKTKQELESLRKRMDQMSDESNRLKNENSVLKQKMSEEMEKLNRELNESKAKHWCSVCLQEAQYYCCWIGSYCSPICQNIHWKSSHKEVCRRKYV